MAYEFALITGASSGIGAAFARELPPETGLLLTGRDRDRLAILAEELRAEGRQVETVAADLAQAAGRETVIAAASGRPVELLINNAGLGRLGRLIDNPPERAARHAGAGGEPGPARRRHRGGQHPGVLSHAVHGHLCRH
jgi:short-subunit dehydrogenase